MKRTPIYEITIVQEKKPFVYFYEKSQIILGPFKMYRKEAIQYCKNLQKYMGDQVKIGFKKITFKIAEK